MRLIRPSLALLPWILLTAGTPAPLNGLTVKNEVVKIEPVRNNNLFTTWNLYASGLSENAFIAARQGFDRLSETKKLNNKSILTIIDFSRTSNQKRFYVLDMLNGKLLFQSLVAHGQGSGTSRATDFSNETDSHKSSLGFYITDKVYNGSNGYSLKLRGCEKGINDNAMNRAIVIHGAAYVSQRFINQHGYLGRSHGCPALPTELNNKIIDVIKNGSCVFIYHPDKKYLTRSEILNQ